MWWPFGSRAKIQARVKNTLWSDLEREYYDTLCLAKVSTAEVGKDDTLAAPRRCGEIANKLIMVYRKITAPQVVGGYAFTFNVFLPEGEKVPNNEKAARNKVCDPLIKSYISYRGSQFASLCGMLRDRVTLLEKDPTNAAHRNRALEVAQEIRRVKEEDEKLVEIYPDAIRAARGKWVFDVADMVADVCPAPPEQERTILEEPPEATFKPMTADIRPGQPVRIETQKPRLGFNGKTINST